MATIDTIADRSTGSAIAGKAYFETSTNKFIVFNGTAWIELDSDGVGAVYENRWGASFDGASYGDYVAVSAASDLSISGDCSISAWFKPSSVSGYSYIFSLADGRVGASDRAFGLSGTQMVANTYGFGYNQPFTHTAIAVGNWYHAVVVFTSSAARMYLNGSDLGTKSMSTGTIAYSQTVIGGMLYNSGYHFEGLIEDVAVFDAALSAADITKIYNGTAPNGKPTDLTLAASYDTDRTSNLKGYWRMGDDSSDTATSGGSIATITDSSGNGNDATQSDTTSQPTFKALASSTTSLSFDGSQYLESGTSSVFDVSSGFSISAWLKPNSSSLHNMIAYRRNGANGYQFFSQDGGIIYYGGNGNRPLNTTLNLDQWNHVVLVHTGSQITGYVNGVAGTSLADSYITPGTADFYVGRHPAAASYNLDGELDEFAFFNTALSASNIASLAASRGAHIVNDLSLSPVAYYRMGEDDSLTDGASASQITDASGNGNHATQTGTTEQPTASVESVIYV